MNNENIIIESKNTHIEIVKRVLQCSFIFTFLGLLCGLIFLNTKLWFFSFIGTLIGIICAVIFVFSLVIFLYARKMRIVVTDKRVYGIAQFGKRVDLPIDLISAVGTCLFKGIIVSTSSGAIRFLLISNQSEIHKTISNLLINRQSNKQEKVNYNISTTEELKKYKELLDNDVITKEEFEAKKKQLLNLKEE